MLEKLFALSERKTTVRTEILAGLTTFMTMAYILFLAPSLLSLGGMDKDAVLIATALAGGLVTIAMGVFVNYPICLAPGVGMLAFYSFTVVIGMGIPWQTALGAVFISGVVFLILTVTSIRQMIVEGIPTSMKNAITVGIGLFITIIGLKLSGLMAIRLSLTPGSLEQVGMTHGNFVPGAEETILELGTLNNPEHLLALFGLVFTALLIARKIPGSMLIGIFGTSLVGYVTGICHLPDNFSLMAIPDFSRAAFFQLNIGDAFNMGLVTIIFTFTFVELFDSMGTMIGTATKAGILDPESGKFPGLSRAFFTDACGVSIGALLGTSTVTAFVESAAGVGAGGRTGLTAVTCGICFLLSLFFSPFMMLIPEAATSPILVIVGVFMMEQIHTIDFSDFTEGFPAFMVIVLMPFTYNIANGVSAGLILYPLLKILTGRGKELHWIMYVLAAVVIARYVFLN
ncbi:MAG: NCS2 family permease [Megasphaera sp.]|jgi:AGZA family xanthine/uracil permease-like MFS transporter|uniref:NCS2 family permease n=1 Tax=Megasphaera sueciensis TaxID=349094 RepID=UPI003D075C3F|nr:NCS2 family permease [Megasphaera sp.]MCI1823629.1 NCS2 family permease [Megasphaera sp.]